MSAMDILIGFICGFIATIAFNVAPIMQKSGFNQISKQFPGKEPFPLGQLLKNKIWFFGFLVNLIGGVPYIIALSNLGVSVLQPLTAFGYILLVYVAVKKLGEKLTKTGIIGVVVLALMPLFLTLSAVTNTTANMLDIVPLTTIIIFTVICGIASLVLAIVDMIAKNKKHSSLLWAITSGLLAGLGSIWGQAIFTFVQSGGYNLFRDLGLVPEKLAAADPYVVGAIVSVIPTLVFTVIGFIGQQVGYKKGNASLVYPVTQSVNIIVSITGGIMIFGQIVGVPACYAIAIAFTLIGTLLVGKFQTIITATPPKKEMVQETDT